MRHAFYQQRPGLDTRLVDEDAYVITPVTIQHLNATGAMVWLLLEEPATRREVLAGMREIYADVAWQRLSADLGKLLAAFQKTGLIDIVKTPKASPASPVAKRARRR